MPESPSHSAVGTNPLDGDGIDLGASTLVDLVWSLALGQSVTAESAWQAVHTALRAQGVSEDEVWTERAAAKGLEIALAARAVARDGKEPTNTSVKAHLAAQNGSTGDYKKYSAIVAKAKLRYLQDRKIEPLYVAPTEAPKPAAAQRETRDAEISDEPEHAHGTQPTGGMISFDLSERMAAEQLRRFTVEKETALRDLRNAQEVATTAQQATIQTLSVQLQHEQARSARGHRMNLLLTAGIIVASVIAAGACAMLYALHGQTAKPIAAPPATAVPSPTPTQVSAEPVAQATAHTVTDPVPAERGATDVATPPAKTPTTSPPADAHATP